MKKGKTKRRLRSFLIWTFWVLLVQFILINISAALYAYKITHLYEASPEMSLPPSSRNIFAKTWRLFTGPKFYREALTEAPGFAYSTVTLKTKKDILIEAWYGKTDSTYHGTVILFHGLTYNKSLVLDEAIAFKEMGYNVMLVDARCHGNSGGNFTTIGYRESEEVKLAYDYILQKGEKNIFLWGVSMGAVQIIKAISDYQLNVSGIVIEIPFLSLQSHLKGRARILGFPEQPFGFLTSFWIGAERGFNGWGFVTTSYAKNVKCPVLMQYGEKDDLVLQYETDAIYNAIASTRKRLVMYDNATHELFLKKDPVTWKKEVRAFLKKEVNLTF